MKSKDILKMLDSEIDHLTPSTPNENITSTPINVKNRNVAMQTTKRSFLKTRTFQALCASLVCIALVVAVAVPFMVKDNGGNGDGNFVPTITASTSYVEMDINPSISYVVDKNDKVTNVISRNHDGDILLSNGFKETLIGKDIDNAVTMVLDQATKLGYIDAISIPNSNDKQAKVNSVKISVVNDSIDKAKDILSSTKKSMKNHLKSKGILMAVGGKVLDKSAILQDVNAESIEAWNEKNNVKDSFHFETSSDGKTEEDLANIFKNEYLTEFVGDMFDDMIEDLEDMLKIVGDIREKEAELEEFSIVKDYWTYKKLIESGLETNEDIIDIVEDITESIDEFNEELNEKLEDDDDEYSIIPKLFRKIENGIDLSKLELMHKAYFEESPIYKTTGKQKLESLIDNVKKDISKIDTLLGVMKEIFKGIDDAIDKIGNDIKDKLNTARMTIDEYYNACKVEINKTYDSLINRNKNNSSTINPDEYDELLENFMDGLDIDDLFD